MTRSQEGYVLHAYGPETYLHHAVASVLTLRRHDATRPVALCCPPEHEAVLQAHGFRDLFERVEPLPEAHRSILGFKHHLHRFMPFERTLFADSDIIWGCNPDGLWQQLAAFPFTSMGDPSADVWFGAAKDAGIVPDLMLNRRRRTLRRFGLTHLPRALTALVYARESNVTRTVCETAQAFFDRRAETHFTSRLAEAGRALESCEWSLAMAMATLELPVYPWFRGYDSPLLNYYPHTVEHDADFTDMRYRLWCSRAVYDVQGLPNAAARRAAEAVLHRLPRGRDHLTLTPLALHFGDLPFKQPFYDFAERVWAGEVTA